MNYENIPREMRELRQWVAYKSYPDKQTGKYKKIMYSPVTFELAKSTEPETWASFEQAKSYCQRKRYQGLAFCLLSGITFIDIDHAINKETGAISEMALTLMRRLPDSFTETSVSGSGVHIFVRGGLPAGALKRNDAKGIEMYDGQRFACVTGNLLNGCRELRDYTGTIEQINYEFIGKRPPAVCRPSVPATQSDNELIEAILNSRQCTKFNELYNGSIIGYPSHSNADAALVSILAWWTSDYAQIDRIFRSSGLMRDKWDRRLYGGTYGSALINNALSLVTPRTETRRIQSRVRDFEM